MRVDFLRRGLHTLIASVDFSESPTEEEIRRVVEEHPEIVNVDIVAVVNGQRPPPMFRLETPTREQLERMASKMPPPLRSLSPGSLSTKGHVCGRDNGKPTQRSQPRNALCCCGSGRKAKKCCVYFPQPEQGDSSAVPMPQQ